MQGEKKGVYYHNTCEISWIGFEFWGAKQKWRDWIYFRQKRRDRMDVGYIESRE